MDIFELFLENFPYPVWIKGIDTTIIYINKPYEMINNNGIGLALFISVIQSLDKVERSFLMLTLKDAIKM